MRLRALLIILCLASSMIPVGIIGGLQGFDVATTFIGIILVVTLMVALAASDLISRPIEQLTKNIDEISKGKLEVQLEKSEIYEINDLTDSLNRVLASLKLAIHKVGVKRGEIFEQTVKAKKEAEEKYHKLINNIEDWIFELTPTGIISATSEKITPLLGYKPEEIIKQPIYTYMPPEQTKKIKTHLNNTKKTQDDIEEIETWWTHKDSHELCLKIKLLPEYNDDDQIDGYHVIAKNMYPLKQAEDKIEDLTTKLSEMKNRMRTILNENTKTIPQTQTETYTHPNTENYDYKFIFDETSHIIDCSDSMIKHLGYQKQELLSLNIHDIDVLESKEEIIKKIQNIKKQGQTRIKTIHKHKNGKSFFVTETLQYQKNQKIFEGFVKKET